MPIDCAVAPAQRINAYSRGCRLAFLATAGLLIVLLFVLGSQPIAVGLFPEPWDKLIHFVFFGSITALLWLANSGRQSLILFLMVAAVAAFDEWHQAGLPGRSADYADFLTDVSAAFLVIAGLKIWAGK